MQGVEFLITSLKQKNLATSSFKTGYWLNIIILALVLVLSVSFGRE